jgi:membrane fusion protein (multidrug efflux system)
LLCRTDKVARRWTGPPTRAGAWADAANPIGFRREKRPRIARYGGCTTAWDMRTPFARTLTFLEARDGARSTYLLGGALAVAALWAAWLCGTTTQVWAVSESGRLLASGAASPIQTPMAGVVALTSLSLGAEVKAGDVLVTLDASAEELRKREEEERGRGLAEAALSVEAILEAERGLATATARASATRLSSAAAHAKATADVAALARQQDEAMRKLREASLVSGLDALKVAEDLQRQRGQVAVAVAETATAAADLDRARREASVRLLGLQRELVELRTRIAASRATVAQLEWEVARRQIRAPVDGVVADIEPLPRGAAVSPGQKVAVVVPRARLRWVAHFPVREAVGRIQPGQRARIRVDAFPWTAYGPLTAVVTGVGSEQNEQRVRVELDVAFENPNIPLAHGMTGTTDIEIERLSPLRLLLRLAGQHVESAPTRKDPSKESSS